MRPWQATRPWQAMRPWQQAMQEQSGQTAAGGRGRRPRGLSHAINSIKQGKAHLLFPSASGWRGTCAVSGIRASISQLGCRPPVGWSFVFLALLSRSCAVGWTCISIFGLPQDAGIQNAKPTIGDVANGVEEVQGRRRKSTQESRKPKKKRKSMRAGTGTVI
jgi:hypothetical protein